MAMVFWHFFAAVVSFAARVGTVPLRPVEAIRDLSRHLEIPPS